MKGKWYFSFCFLPLWCDGAADVLSLLFVKAVATAWWIHIFWAYQLWQPLATAQVDIARVLGLSNIMFSLILMAWLLFLSLLLLSSLIVYTYTHNMHIYIYNYIYIYIVGHSKMFPNVFWISSSQNPAVSLRCPSPLGLQRGPGTRVHLRGGLVPFRAVPRDLWAWYSAQCHGRRNKGKYPDTIYETDGVFLMEVNLAVLGIFWSLRDDTRPHRSVSSEVPIKPYVGLMLGVCWEQVGTMLGLCWVRASIGPCWDLEH